MKKTLITVASCMVAGLSCLAQGNINFQGGLNQLLVSAGDGVGQKVSGVNVTLLFSSSSTLPSIASIAGSGFGTGSLGGSYVTTSSSFDAATAWGAIMNDSSYFQVNGVTPGSPVLANTGGTGGWVYNSSSSYSAGNVAAGTTYFAYVLGWVGPETTLAAAAAAGDALGWSQVFQYTPTTGVTGAPNTSGLAGKFAVISPVPEPATMALAALGGASLLLFRRRK